MGSRVAIFKTPKDSSQDSDKLHELYWNRAELKKAYAEARDEQYRLNKRIEEERGSRARIEQKLENLENLLIDPEWVHTVAVHYQLRALNNRLKRRMGRFAEQLKQQREQRQHQKILSEWNARRSGASQKVEQEIGKLRLRSQALEERVLDEQSRYDSMNVLARLFKKGSLSAALTAANDELAELRQQEQACLQRLEELRGAPPPDQQGLDVAAKRSINFMIIAFAQQLFILFGDDGLAGLVKEAGDKSVGGIQYGTREECERLLDRIRERWNAFDNVMDYVDVLQQRARLLSEKALFSQQEDTVPVAATVAGVIEFGVGGTTSYRDGNLLGENYWDIGKVLSR